MPEKRKEKPYTYAETGYSEKTPSSKVTKGAKKVVNIVSQPKISANLIKSKDTAMKNSKNAKTNKETRVAPQSVQKSDATPTNPLNTFFSLPFTEPKDFQEAIFSISFQGAEEFNDAAEIAVKNLQDNLEVGAESLEAVMASGSAVAEAAEHVNQEYVRFANKLFNEGVEASKDFFKCQTVNDAFALQSNLFKSTMESCLESFIKTNEIALQCASKALKPINEQTVTACKKLNYPYGNKV